VRVPQILVFVGWCLLSVVITSFVVGRMTAQPCFDPGTCEFDPISAGLFIGAIIWLSGTLALVKFWNR